MRPNVHRNGLYGLDFDNLGDRAVLPFADGELKSVLMMISNRLSNAEWHCEEGDPSGDGVSLLIVEELFTMVEHYALNIIWKMFVDGYCDFDAYGVRPLGVGDDRLLPAEVWGDERARVVRVYDDVFLNTGKTRFALLRPSLFMLDTVNNADLNLIDNYGAMGVLSPENSPVADGYVDDEQYKELQECYNRVHGVKFGKWSLMVTRRAVKYQPIALPIAALQLSEKRKAAVASLLQALDIPKELHALFESAKFLNMQEAERTMYSSCVTHWAEVMCCVMRDIYARNKVYGVVGLPNNDFWFDFAGVPALQDAQATAAQRTRETVDWLLGMREQWPEKREYIDKRINDLIDSI